MTIEHVRDYWNARPCNIRHSKHDIDTHPLLYDWEVRSRKYQVEYHIPSFAEFARWGDKWVLDMGCGIGTDSISFASMGAKVTALDVSRKSLDIAHKRAQATGTWKNISFIEADMETWRPKDVKEVYDLVYAFGTIHHTPHPGRAVGTAWYCLKPGGTFKLMLYNRYSWKVLSILVRNRRQFFQRKSVDEIVALESEAQTGCPITYTYTKDSARKLLEGIGFVVTDISIAHIFPYVVKDYINYKYTIARPWRWMLGREFEWWEKHFGWHMCITARRPQ